MAYEDFLNALAASRGLKNRKALLEQAEKPTYAMNTNLRGKKLTAKLEQLVNRPLKGLRVVDIGCAYGGIAIELARAGAKVVGVDVVAHYLKLARENAKNDVDVSFILADACRSDFVDKIGGPNSVDLIIASDVLEHIYDSVGLIGNLEKCLNSRGVIYFKVPNGLSLPVVLREVHKVIFGISLLDPDCWHYFLEGRPRVYYRRWEYYKALFGYFGFNTSKLLNSLDSIPIDALKGQIEEGLDQVCEILQKEAFTTKAQSELMHEAVKYYRSEAMLDLTTLDWKQLRFKYIIDFWEGVFAKSDELLSFYSSTNSNSGDKRVCRLYDETPYVRLTDEPRWLTVSVESQTHYLLKGEVISSSGLSKEALVQIEFLDSENTPISPPYRGISCSPDPGVGAYHYVPVEKKGLSAFHIELFAPQRARSVRMGFRSWGKTRKVLLSSEVEISLFPDAS